MTKQERDKNAQKRLQLMRLGIPAAVCLVSVVIVVLATKVWQPSFGQARLQPMDLRGQWLGMQLASTGSQSAVALGVPPEVKGVVVANVEASSRAVQAGLSPGDVVARIDGTTVATLVDLYSLTTKLDAARPLQVDFLRAGRPMTVIVPPTPDNTMPANAVVAPAARPVAADMGGWATAPVRMQ
jgi:S1-C subfamily serine protease